MSEKEIKENMNKTVWHIGLGKAVIKEWNEKKKTVLLSNPKNENETKRENQLHRLELL